MEGKKSRRKLKKKSYVSEVVKTLQTCDVKQFFCYFVCWTLFLGNNALFFIHVRSQSGLLVCRVKYI